MSKVTPLEQQPAVCSPPHPGLAAQGLCIHHLDSTKRCQQGSAWSRRAKWEEEPWPCLLDRVLTEPWDHSPCR